MRSMKLLAATAVLAAFVAGPVLAQDAGTTPSTTSTTKTTAHKHSTKKPTRHKKPASSTSSTTPATEGTVTPAK
jgi:nitrate/TMAO reductase-like tetraheme cytochrome c subunit